MLTNFEVKESDLFLGDIAYGTKTSMEHCLAGKGNFIFRIRRNAFDVYDKNGNKIDLIEKLNKLKKNKTLRLKCCFKSILFSPPIFAKCFVSNKFRACPRIPSISLYTGGFRVKPGIIHFTDSYYSPSPYFEYKLIKHPASRASASALVREISRVMGTNLPCFVITTAGIFSSRFSIEARIPGMNTNSPVSKGGLSGKMKGISPQFTKFER